MITLTNDPNAQAFPVNIQSSVGVNGTLELSANGVAMAGDDDLFVKHRRLETSDPVVVPISIMAPDTGWQISAVHELDSREQCPWETDGSQCSHTWAETERQYAVVVTASHPSSGQKKRTVYLKVRPEPDLPEP